MKVIVRRGETEDVAHGQYSEAAEAPDRGNVYIEDGYVYGDIRLCVGVPHQAIDERIYEAN